MSITLDLAGAAGQRGAGQVLSARARPGLALFFPKPARTRWRSAAFRLVAGAEPRNLISWRLEVVLVSVLLPGSHFLLL